VLSGFAGNSWLTKHTKKLILPKVAKEMPNQKRGYYLRVKKLPAGREDEKCCLRNRLFVLPPSRQIYAVVYFL